MIFACHKIAINLPRVASAAASNAVWPSVSIAFKFALFWMRILTVFTWPIKINTNLPMFFDFNGFLCELTLLCSYHKRCGLSLFIRCIYVRSVFKKYFNGLHKIYTCKFVYFKKYSNKISFRFSIYLRYLFQLQTRVLDLHFLSNHSHSHHFQ